MEQVKSVLSGQTNQGETSVQVEDDTLAADQIVLAWNGL
jgi:hypothetical protein